MADLGCPLVIHQPSYSMLNRWVEKPDETGADLLATASRELEQIEQID